MALVAFLFSVGITYVLAMAGRSAPTSSPADVALLAAGVVDGTLLVAHDGIPSRERLDASCGGSPCAAG